MRISINAAKTLVVASLAATMSLAHAQVEDFEVVDPLIDAFFGELAKRQGYNRVYLPDANTARIGAIYYVENSDVACADALSRMAKDGVPVRIFLFDDFTDEKRPQPLPIKDWTSIKISKFLGANVEADLGAKLPKLKAELSAAAAAIRSTNAQVLFATREAPALAYRRLAESRLKENGVERASDVVSNASGLVVPFSQLVVQKFEFDETIIKQAQGSFSAKFLKLFGARLAGEYSKSLISGTQLPTNAVLAFKAAALRFETVGCK